MPQVCISQPDGLSLGLSQIGTSSLEVTVEGGGLSARARVLLDPNALREFFRDAATATTPKRGRWEYKSPDEDFMLHAASDEPAGPDAICLWIDLVSTEDDHAGWQVKGTIVLPVSRFREYATAVEREFSRQPKP